IIGVGARRKQRRHRQRSYRWLRTDEKATYDILVFGCRRKIDGKYACRPPCVPAKTSKTWGEKNRNIYCSSSLSSFQLKTERNRCCLATTLWKQQRKSEFKRSEERRVGKECRTRRIR